MQKSDKSLDTSEDKEEGECTASDDEGEGDNAERECEKEEKEEGDTASPNQYEEGMTNQKPQPVSCNILLSLLCLFFTIYLSIVSDVLFPAEMLYCRISFSACIATSSSLLVVKDGECY